MSTATLNQTGTDRVAAKRKANAAILRVKDEPGRYEWIGLSQLNVDHASRGGYQRDQISKARIAQLVAEWSWVACGVLIVALRKDGTYLIIDGQHRKYAADQRDDISSLPCLVFDSVAVADEAKAFLDINDNRGTMQTFSRYLAALKSLDPLAIATKEMVESTGYNIVGNAQGRKFCVSCIKTLSKSIGMDPLLAERVWRLCCDLYAGEQVMDRFFVALFTLERALIRRGGQESIFDAHNRQKLTKIGTDEVMKSIRKAIEYKGKGGEKAYAQGVIDALNTSRSARRIEPLC